MASPAPGPAAGPNPAADADSAEPDVAGPPMARPYVAAGALIRNRRAEVLMVKPTYKDGWDLPGGYVEPGESPADACAREVTEELGLTLRPGPLLVLDWAPHPAEGDKLLFVFDGGIRDDDAPAPVPDGHEIAEARYWPADTLSAITPARLARRLHLAVTAAHDHQTVYAEHGTPATPPTSRPNRPSRPN